MHRLSEVSAEIGAVLIEDAAQAAGAELGGVPLGSFGSLSVLSFGRGKGTTAGAGGALLAHDEIGRRVVGWAAARVGAAGAGVRQALGLAAQWVLGRPRLFWAPSSIPMLRIGETVYHPPGPADAMSSASVSALAVSLAASERESQGRRRLAERLLRLARRSERVRAVEPLDPTAAPGYLRLPLLARGGSVTGAVEQLGMHGVAPGYPSELAALRPFGARVLNAGDRFAGASALATTLLTFPTHGLVSETDLAALEAWLGGDESRRDIEVAGRAP
jgi:dTDP-4-amino-4,6-dideoxygalactose transaminase